MKNRFISRKLLFVILGITIITSSCTKDILDQTNPNAITPDSFWKTEDDAVKGIMGTYSALTQITSYSRFEIFTSDYRDDVVNGFGTSERTNIGSFNGTADTNGAFWVWSAHYKGVTRANEVIANVPKITMDQTTKNNILGEAYFLRAFNYFNLLISWNNIPLITVPISEIANPKTITQALPSAVWKQIELDLIEAKKLLPNSWPANQKGRVTMGGATGMLGKMYLYQNKNLEAKKEFLELKGKYILTPDYADNFSAATENNSESLFEIQLIADGNQGWGSDAPGSGKGAAFLPDLAPKPFTGQDGMRINQWVLDLFLDEKTISNEIDPRAFETLFFNSTQTTTYRGKVLASRTYENKTYTDVFPTGGTNVWCNKHLDWKINKFTNSLGNGWHGSGNNIRILRYADVLLMLAEAEFKLNGSTTIAIDAINEVRRRADMPIFSVITMKDIEDERVKELSVERTRYFDLLRWGKVKSRIVDNPQFKSESAGTSSYKPGREYMDIPLNELDANPNFKHNPGYF